MILGHYSKLLTCSLLLISYHSLHASETLSFGQYALQTKPLDTQWVKTEKDQLAKAQFNSGMGLALSNALFDVNIDYLFKGHVERADENVLGDLSQALSASMRSGVFNDLFLVDANIQANSVFDAGDGVYHYAITPSFSRSFNKQLDLDVAYNYRMAKPSGLGLMEETRGYSVGLNGSMGQGRFVWEGVYSDSDMFRDQSLGVETTEFIDFNSSYRLVADLHLEFSGLIKNRELPKSGTDQVNSEKQFGAGFLWSPSERYSFSLNVNKVEKTANSQQDIFGGGKFTWSPKHDLDMSVGYGDDLQDGTRGVVFSTKLDLDKS